MEDEEYPSDSDQSDDDYNPDGNDSDVPSEVDSDGDAESGDEDFKPSNSKSAKPGKRKRRTPAKTFKRKSLRSEPVADEEEKKQNDTSQTEAETNEDDAEKQRVDALWADFLGGSTDNTTDATKTNSSKKEANNSSESSGSKDVLDNDLKKEEKKEEKKSVQPERKTITEIFDFAGETVEVEKEVEVSKEPLSVAKTGIGQLDGPGRASQRAKIGSILDHLGKAKKISTLEKTKLDWNNFKKKEGIDEELQTHNKGKGGYLEKQDFLQRTDLRQFEIEKSQRVSTRKK